MNRRSFALWVTGIPASGKTTIVRELVGALHARNVFPVVLESDALRSILTPHATYDDEERERFYRQMTLLGMIIIRSGVPVVFDATANKRIFRDHARSLIERFVEVYVDTPAELCRMRDPKGIYAAADTGRASSVPGIQAPYEPPLRAEVSLDGREPAAKNAAHIMAQLEALAYL